MSRKFMVSFDVESLLNNIPLEECIDLAVNYISEGNPDIKLKINNWFIRQRQASCFFFSRDMFADVMSVDNRNMKQARAIEFDYTNLLAML